MKAGPPGREPAAQAAARRHQRATCSAAAPAGRRMSRAAAGPPMPAAERCPAASLRRPPGAGRPASSADNRAHSALSGDAQRVHVCRAGASRAAGAGEDAALQHLHRRDQRRQALAVCQQRCGGVKGPGHLPATKQAAAGRVSGLWQRRGAAFACCSCCCALPAAPHGAPVGQHRHQLHLAAGCGRLRAPQAPRAAGPPFRLRPGLPRFLKLKEKTALHGCDGAESGGAGAVETAEFLTVPGCLPHRGFTALTSHAHARKQAAGQQRPACTYTHACMFVCACARVSHAPGHAAEQLLAAGDARRRLVS